MGKALFFHFQDESGRLQGYIKKNRVGDQLWDLFGLLDSISLQTRLDMEIAGSVINSFPDLPIQEHTTRNLNAYKYFILGRYTLNLSFPGGETYNYKKAVDLDSSLSKEEKKARVKRLAAEAKPEFENQTVGQCPEQRQYKAFLKSLTKTD